MNVQMELYTRGNSTTPFVFGANDLSQINQSNFDRNSDTKFLIGGYTDGYGAVFKPDTISALLAHSNFKVFIVNWFKGSATTYEQAVANGRMVGAILSRFIELLKNTTGHPLTKIHLIGHSLGAHICGHAGDYLLGELARISGLDPAGPFYQNTDPVVRLSTNDAKFVDITHTNAGSLWTGAVGIDEKIGHLDFYPNGGSQQPGYYNQFQLGSLGPCRSCGLNGTRCAEMGFIADQYAKAGRPLPAPDKFYLNTNGASPYCQN